MARQITKLKDYFKSDTQINLNYHNVSTITVFKTLSNI